MKQAVNILLFGRVATQNIAHFQKIIALECFWAPWWNLYHQKAYSVYF